ncbi:MAG: hypothetical protein ACOX1M_07700 [Erysipelotrichaceae bacterium]|jgi:neutral ceramidase
MKIGFKEIKINPEFPVNRMLNKYEKIIEVSDDLYCRILVIDSQKEGKNPWFHVSVDSVEIWMDVRNDIKLAIEETLNRKIDIVVSATHSHNCPCMTTDYEWNKWLIQKIKENIVSIELKQYKKIEFNYNYRYFNKLGDSREADGNHPVVHLYAETLSFYGDGKRIGTILIYNSHPTIKDLRVGPFTSEYPGYCIKTMKERYQDEFFTFMLGPAGDVSPHFVRGNRSYEEIARLSEKLIAEYQSQLSNQKELQEVNRFVYREKSFPLEQGNPFDMGNIIIPKKEKMTEQERKILFNYIDDSQKEPSRELEPMEKTNTYMISQLILSDKYSIIFAPFELYSEYYGSVNKQTTSLISISNGFNHYLTGLYLNHLVLHGGINSRFGRQMKKDIWELFGKWSLQKELN